MQFYLYLHCLFVFYPALWKLKGFHFTSSHCSVGESVATGSVSLRRSGVRAQTVPVTFYISTLFYFLLFSTLFCLLVIRTRYWYMYTAEEGKKSWYHQKKYKNDSLRLLKSLKKCRFQTTITISLIQTVIRITTM